MTSQLDLPLLKTPNNSFPRGFSYLSLEERRIIETMLKEGKRVIEISRRLARHHSTIGDEIRKNGGKEQYNAEAAQENFFKRTNISTNTKVLTIDKREIPPPPSTPPIKSGKFLSFEERQKIEELLGKGNYVTRIARMINRPDSTISYEVRTNTIDGKYDAINAHRKARERRMEGNKKSGEVLAHRYRICQQQGQISKETSSSLEERISNLEMQIEILFEKIKGLNDSN